MVCDLREHLSSVSLPSALAREYLVAGSPFDLGPYYDSLRERPACRELAEVLRSGEPAKWSSASDGRDWASELNDAAFARRITDAMHARGAFLAPAMAEALIDIPGRRLWGGR